MEQGTGPAGPAIGKHIILEMWEANNTNSPDAIRSALTDACNKGNLMLLKVLIHQFEPFGISGIAMIAESHITIHTWPEYSFIAVDIYSSNRDADINRVAQAMKSAFSPGQVNQVEIQRGKSRPPRPGPGPP